MFMKGKLFNKWQFEDQQLEHFKEFEL